MDVLANCSGMDTTFSVFHSGKFKTLEHGMLTYDGGDCHVLESPAEALFGSLKSGLNISMYGQRIWYKMPYEDLKELKILCNGSDNFQKMCEAAIWTKAVDIYMEADNAETPPMDEVDDNMNDINGGEEDGNLRRERGANYRASKEAEAADAEARVQNIVATFVDDNEDDDYQRTPPASDSEDEGCNNPYERWRTGNGELEIRQVFESTTEFREAVLEYALKGAWNVQFVRWGTKKSEAKCGVVAKKKEDQCTWRIYCSYEESIGQWMVKTFQDVHTCFKDGFCKILSDEIIARLVLNDIRNDPNFRPKSIQDQISQRYDIAVSTDKCRKAKKKALDIIQSEFDEQYSRIKDYELHILETNVDSTTDLRTVIGDGELEVFDRFYVCFAALRQIWTDYCRPIFGIDGCFLKSTTKGQLLAAVGRDANNQIFPIAWAVVNVESTDTWVWFIQKLKKDFDLKNGDGFTLVSDRQKGLLIAVEQELPMVEHRMCARHIYGNLKKAFPRQPKMKKLFWQVVESHNKGDYDASLAKFKEFDLEIFDALMSKNPEHFSRAFFKTTSTCEDALNNFSESYNSAIEKARALPLVEMLETVRRQSMSRIDIRKQVALNHKGKFSPKVSKVLAVEEVERKHCRIFPGPTGQFEVKERGVAYAVNMKHKTCACRRWDLTGIPCRHALRVVMDKKTYNTDDLVSRWYLTSTWQSQYSDSIKPMNGMKFWNTCGEPAIEPPPREVNKGRKKKPQKRIKGVHESPTKGKKVTQHNRVMHCYRCGLTGHNSLGCRNSGVPNKPRPPKKRKTKNSGMADTISLTAGEGPSQVPLTQPSQSSADRGEA